MLAGRRYVHAQDKPAGNSGERTSRQGRGDDQEHSGGFDHGRGGIRWRRHGEADGLDEDPARAAGRKRSEERDCSAGARLAARRSRAGSRAGIDEGDGHTITALAVIVMKQADVAAKQQHDRDDWQKRGVGGLVTKVDAATGTITISSGGMGANRSIAVHIAEGYDSAPLRARLGEVRRCETGARQPIMAQIKAGDQLRARGTRNPDGSEVSAEEVVSGSFRNIAGTIKAIDAASNTMTVQDAISKSAVVVKVSPDSQMKKLPAEMAQRIAMRLKGGGGRRERRSSGRQRPSTNRRSWPGRCSPVLAGRGAAGASRARAGGNGPPDLQRMLSRLPNSTLADLQKGDAVMIVSTEGGDSGAVTAITLLAGVDAILTAAPSRSASSLLSPWSLGAPGGEGEAAQ